MAFICGGLKILKFCSGAQVQGIFRPRRSGFKGLSLKRAVAFPSTLTSTAHPVSSGDQNVLFQTTCIVGNRRD